MLWWLKAVLFLVAFIGATSASAQQPLETDFCQLASSPESFDKKLIKLSGTVSFGFEDFRFVGLKCSGLPVWLTYGGKGGTGTIFCCGQFEVDKSKTDLEIDGFKSSLRKDATYHRFRRTLEAEVRQLPSGVPCYDCYLYEVEATLVGRFFFRGYGDLGGWGHFGCCSLFVIEQVAAFKARPTKWTSKAVCTEKMLEVPGSVTFYRSRGDGVNAVVNALREPTDGHEELIFEHRGDFVNELGDRYSEGWVSQDRLTAYRVAFKENDDGTFRPTKIKKSACRLVPRARH